MLIEPVVFEGPRVRVEPLTLRHLEGLTDFCLDDALWRYRTDWVHTRDEMRVYIEKVLDKQSRGEELPFAVIEKASNRVCASTRFMSIDITNRGVEIGGTFVDPRWQRTFVNTEVKYLMLRHAFETWGCVRVFLKTDSLNEQSRRAILRLGAKEEGTLRNHMIMPDGRLRHSIYFSILDSEWPSVKANLDFKLRNAR